jgi:hypothetical protein
LKLFFLKPILEKDFYPFEEFLVLNQEIAKHFGKGDTGIIRDIGKYSINMSFSTVFKLIVESTSLYSFFKNIGPFVFDYYYSFGKMEVEKVDIKNKRVEITLRELSFKDKIFNERIRGALEGALMYKGLKNPKVELKEKKDFPLYILTWE